MTPAQPALDAMMEGLPDYDAGLLNDYGGGNVDWWWDYLRAEIGRANDHWRELVPTLAAEVRALQACNRGLVRLNEATEARAIKAETEVRAQRETIAGLEARVEAMTARDERAVLAMRRMQAAMMRQHLTSHDYETLRGTSQAIAVGLREFLDAHAPREIALALSGDAPND
jgi:hypothetical protein